MTGQRPSPLASAAGPALAGPWLALARVAWVLLAGATAAYFAAGLPAAVRQLAVPCTGAGACANFRLYPEDVRVLEQAGLSLQFYAAGAAALTLLALAPIFGAAVVLFWRRSSTWMAIYFSFYLILLGPTVTSNVSGPLLREHPTWGWVSALQTLGLWTAFTTYYLFPNGQLVPRWAWIISALIAVFSVLYAFPGLLTGLGIAAVVVAPLLSAGVLALFAAGLATQVYRYRVASGPIERQQTKWVVLAFSAYALDEIVYFGLGLYPPMMLPGLPHLLRTAGGGTFNLFFLSLQPVVLALAILRYRLWDVDLLIRRTLVYGALTILLALMYFGSVLALQQVLRALVGANSNAAIIVSVLAIAALAAPLRKRVQAFIDRRFYRSRYDAARVLAAFGAALRDDPAADLQRLSDSLLDVVDGTLRPERVSLWLRPPKAPD